MKSTVGLLIVWQLPKVVYAIGVCRVKMARTILIVLLVGILTYVSQCFMSFSSLSNTSTYHSSDYGVYACQQFSNWRKMQFFMGLVRIDAIFL